MRRYSVFMILLVFLFSCSSERSFQVTPSKRLNPGKAEKAALQKDRLHAKGAGEGAGPGGIEEGVNNTPPELTSVKLVPEVFQVGDVLGVDVKASDRDGDEVAILYEWTLNEEEAGTSDRLEVPLKRGDQFTVKITPFDGRDHGRFVILRKEVLNVPPVFLQAGNAFFDGENYTCQVIAEDPDGDPLTYSLKSGPEGMKVSPDTGLMTWKVPDGFTGLAQVSIIADDGHDGKAQYDLKVTIREEELEG